MVDTVVADTPAQEPAAPPPSPAEIIFGWTGHLPADDRRAVEFVTTLLERCADAEASEDHRGMLGSDSPLAPAWRAVLAEFVAADSDVVRQRLREAMIALQRAHHEFVERVVPVPQMTVSIDAKAQRHAHALAEQAHKHRLEEIEHEVRCRGFAAQQASAGART